MNFGIICLMILDILMIILFGILIHKLNTFKEVIEKEKEKPTKREHSQVKTSNYNNSFTSRAYDKYKNTDGLYEPVKPHQGIELKVKKED